MEIIDAHQHFWYYSQEAHGWINDEMQAIRRDFLPSHLEPILKENGVHGTIAVQVDQTLEETRFLLELAEQHDFILGVVGWADLQSDNLEDQLDALEHHKKLVGFRHIVQGEQDPVFVLRPEFRRGLERIFERGFTYDLLIYPHQLPAALELLERFPESRVIIDHLAKPYIRSGYHKAWAILMREIAAYPGVYCKWSGMITEADWQRWAVEDLRPYLDTTAAIFGPKRLVFGSDWPVLNVAGTYSNVLGVIRDYIADWPVEDQSAVMGQNARQFYLNQNFD